MSATRFSRQREAIVQTLRARCDHPTAETLYHALRQTHPNISLGTVYRNLSMLEGQGDVIRLAGQDGPDRYDGTTTPHDHLHCRKCGTVVDLMDMGDVLDLSAAKQVAMRHGVVIEDRQVTYFGLCASCKDSTH